jgi:mRNA-degrading endonuclease RelE of RelBE toxin-antitoxin system
LVSCMGPAKMPGMRIEIEPTFQKRLEALARVEQKQAESLAMEILEEGLRNREQANLPPEDEEAIRRQQEALSAVHERLSREPVAIKDGFSGRDHDKVLYGGRGA